jgi:hypothetical protein
MNKRTGTHWSGIHCQGTIHIQVLYTLFLPLQFSLELSELAMGGLEGRKEQLRKKYSYQHYLFSFYVRDFYVFFYVDKQY